MLPMNLNFFAAREQSQLLPDAPGASARADTGGAGGSRLTKLAAAAAS